VTRSDSINELATALAAAQGAIQNAKKDSENPHFRSKYADLAAIWDACRAALAKHGLSVVQSPRLVSAGEALWLVEVETVLLHQSGQSISDVLAVPVGAVSPQGVGSAITYARRYALASFVGVAPEDDDAQSTIGHDRDLREDRPPPRKPAPPPPAKKPAAPPGPHHQRVKVLGIVQRPIDAAGRVKFVVTGDDHKTYSTVRYEDATAAKTAHEAGLPIEITYTVIDDARVIQSLRELDPEPPL